MSEFLGPLALVPVVERLQSELGRDWREIGGAADLTAAESQKFAATPAAYVLLATDRPREQIGSTARMIQPVTGSFGVLIAVEDYRMAKRGAGNADELTTRIRQVRAALLAWKHPEANASKVRLGGAGKFIGRRGSVLIWQDIYSADYQIRKL